MRSNYRVVFNSYPGAFFIKGGGEIQLEKTEEELLKRNVDVKRFNMWKPQTDIDILHHFTTLGGSELVIQPYKRLNKKICISSILWPTSTEEELKNRSYTQYILWLSDLILTNSELESQRLSEFYDLDISRFYKVRNGIDAFYVERSESQIFRNKFNIRSSYILTVANIDRRKNTYNTLAACKKLGLQLVSIGSIKDEDYYNECCNTFDNLIHLGPISDVSILKSAYANCEIFILASLFETPGLAALEAAAQGAKIVVTSHGSTTEYFSKFVTYVNPFDFNDIADGILNEMNKLKTDELRNYVINNFTWSHAAQDTLAAYNKILP